MSREIKIVIWPRLNPACKFTVWIVDYGTGATSNPKTKRKALNLLRKLKKENVFYNLPFIIIFIQSNSFPENLKSLFELVV